MTLFVGGPRHGKDTSVGGPASDTYAVPTGDGKDVHRYRLAPVRMVTAHPLLGTAQTQYEVDVFLTEDINPSDPRDAPRFQQATADAVMRWWIETFGRRTDVSGAQLSPAAAAASPNGHRKPRTWFVALCDECAITEPEKGIPFATARERAEWMTEHNQATGHKPVWRDVEQEVGE